MKTHLGLIKRLCANKTHHDGSTPYPPPPTRVRSRLGGLGGQAGLLCGHSALLDRPCFPRGPESGDLTSLARGLKPPTPQNRGLVSAQEARGQACGGLSGAPSALSPARETQVPCGLQLCSVGSLPSLLPRAQPLCPSGSPVLRDTGWAQPSRVSGAVPTHCGLLPVWTGSVDEEGRWAGRGDQGPLTLVSRDQAVVPSALLSSPGVAWSSP